MLILICCAVVIVLGYVSNWVHISELQRDALAESLRVFPTAEKVYVETDAPHATAEGQLRKEDRSFKMAKANSSDEQFPRVTVQTNSATPFMIVVHWMWEREPEFGGGARDTFLCVFGYRRLISRVILAT